MSDNQLNNDDSTHKSVVDLNIQFDLDDSNLDKKITEALKPYVQGFTRTVFSLKPPTVLYRAGVNYRAKSRSELLYPPRENTPIGRANIVGDPVLYVTSDPKAIYPERQAKEGDRFTVSKWTTTGDCLVNHCGFNLLHDTYRSHRDKKFMSYVDPHGQTEDNKLFDRILAQLFCIRAEDRGNHIYKVTNAVFNLLNMTIEGYKKEKFDGLLYPSIEYPYADNLALTAEFADKSLKFTGADFIHVQKVDIKENTTRFVEVIDTARSISENGEIQWDNQI